MYKYFVSVIMRKPVVAGEWDRSPGRRRLPALLPAFHFFTVLYCAANVWQGGYNPSGGGTGYAILKGDSFQVQYTLFQD